MAWLHKTVRYTGVEFGEAAIVPGSPVETIQRGYGDCKDKAALLVAMLRAAGAGRLVLLADRVSTELVRTQDADSKHSIERNRIEIGMSEMGLATLHVSLEVDGGSFESNSRASYGSQEQKSKEQIENWTKQSFAAKALGKSELMRRDDMTGPFRMTLEVLDAKIAVTGLEDAGVALTPWSLFQSLPYALTADQPSAGSDPLLRAGGSAELELE